MNLNLKVWRQQGGQSKGKFEEYSLENVSEESSFLEMLDALNEQLISKKEDPVAFDPAFPKKYTKLILNGVYSYNVL